MDHRTNTGCHHCGTCLYSDNGMAVLEEVIPGALEKRPQGLIACFIHRSPGVKLAVQPIPHQREFDFDLRPTQLS